MVTKVVMDQALFAPSFLCVFVAAVSTLQVLLANPTMQGLGLEDIRANLAANYTDVVLTNWKVWPPKTRDCLTRGFRGLWLSL